MSKWLEIFVLAFASIFWPTLIVIVVLALRVSHPVKILLSFLVGGLLTCVTVGIAVVFALQGASFMNGSKPSIDPAIYISMGLLSLLAGFVLLHRAGRRMPAKPHDEQTAPSKSTKPSMTERAVERGAPVAFAAGVVLNVVPGTFPIVAMKDIAQLNASDAVKVATVVVFYLIMFAFVEVPIVAYGFAPERTSVAVNAFNAWLKRNGLRIAAYVIVAVGLFLTIRGVVGLFR